jgi:DNA-binding XRE family transcriptional regulator
MSGRPTLFREEFAEQTLKLCRLGATDRELAHFFEVSEQTINAWKEAQPGFLESLKQGKAQADAEVANALYRRACGYEHGEKHYPPDPTSCIFWLKNRRPDLWRDVQAREHAIELRPGELSVAEKSARAQAHLNEVFGSADAMGQTAGPA